MTKRTRRDAVFYVEQTDGIMKARDKVKKYIRMSEMFPNKSTYLKICGVRYNGERNAKLNDKDLEVLNAGIDTVIEGLYDFKYELNKHIYDQWINIEDDCPMIGEKVWVWDDDEGCYMRDNLWEDPRTKTVKWFESDMSPRETPIKYWLRKKTGEPNCAPYRK